MEKKTIIHIGLHKTASTLLQTIIFPKATNYTYLSRPYTQFNHAFNKLQYADDTMYDKSEIERELNQINYDNLLISDESLSGKPMAFGYINRSLIARRLQQVLPQAEIILFLRGQTEMLKSHYNMWVKGYNAGIRQVDDVIWIPDKNYEYQDYLNNSNPELSSLYWNTNNFYLHIDCFKYYELITLYKNLFDKVHVFLYEDLIHHKQEVLQRIEDILEQKLDISERDLKSKVNQSIANDRLLSKIHENKLSLVTQNKYLKKIGKIYLKFKSNPYVDPEQYISQKTKGLYLNNNRKLIEKYPEINLEKYPLAYQI